jgi:hypothetical protein
VRGVIDLGFLLHILLFETFNFRLLCLLLVSGLFDLRLQSDIRLFENYDVCLPPGVMFFEMSDLRFLPCSCLSDVSALLPVAHSVLADLSSLILISICLGSMVSLQKPWALVGMRHRPSLKLAKYQKGAQRKLYIRDLEDQSALLEALELPGFDEDIGEHCHCQGTGETCFRAEQ